MRPFKNKLVSTLTLAALLLAGDTLAAQDAVAPEPLPSPIAIPSRAMRRM